MPPIKEGRVIAAISSMLLGVKVTARASALSFQLPRRSRRRQLSNSSDASATIVVVRLASALAMVAAVASASQPTRSEAPLARFDVDIRDRNYVDSGDVARLREVDRL